IGLDLEEDDALGLPELPQHAVELVSREAGPRRDRQSRLLEHLRGLAPGEEAAELVSADDEDGIVEPLGAKQLDRARMGIETHLVARERGACERKPVLGGGLDGAVSGMLADEDDETLDAESLPCRVGDRDVAEMRRVEGAPEEHYSHSR